MIMGDHRKRDKPHWMDYALALAYETVESEKCQKCGVPAWYAYSENNAIAFEMDHIDCEACAFDEQNNSSKERKRPGRTKYVKAVAEEGFELPTRADFQKEMLQKAEREKAKKKTE
jgi:hypothetical protein